eukprot:CAMPEP_0174306264 /NCGR_PEP_ID=MMETSP0810-20121108/332_1 /TAXON_ID=73025 ORGANISM="Eutreptiella gymnastica-like, Strain CCMP1594" /NCGR_SAMPLE_ID=MMETSP0810 /ASSEMBLY_ACC=CAM_ASM_000659 /LENGTH=90 /DNA_ID=CAMNT_0015412915 /DNA_START=180 /DNA_END=452 /DNA_ORIENTATION=-
MDSPQSENTVSVNTDSTLFTCSTEDSRCAPTSFITTLPPTAKRNSLPGGMVSIPHPLRGDCARRHQSDAMAMHFLLGKRQSTMKGPSAHM